MYKILPNFDIIPKIEVTEKGIKQMFIEDHGTLSESLVIEAMKIHY